MTAFTPAQSVLFTELEKRPMLLAFDHAHGSSDGGAILLSAANRHLGKGLIESLSACLPDARQPGRVDHQLAEMMRQRIDGPARGYADANDAARIGAGPMHKLLAGRDPLKGLDLASQPTLSRFENSVAKVDSALALSSMESTSLRANSATPGFSAAFMKWVRASITSRPVKSYPSLRSYAAGRCASRADRSWRQFLSAHARRDSAFLGRSNPFAQSASPYRASRHPSRQQGDSQPVHRMARFAPQPFGPAPDASVVLTVPGWKAGLSLPTSA